MVLINVRLIGFTLLCLAAACSPGPAGDRDGNPAQEKTGHWPNHPDFKTSPQQAAMPDTLLVVKETKTLRPKFPALDFHYHGGDLASEEDYRTLIAVMDEAGVGMISDMDGGSGEGFDRRLELAQRFQDRFLLFARVDWKGINEPGWSGLAAAELERCFRAGAHGLKISKRLGLGLQNLDGSYIHTDDPRLDAIWKTCARLGKPVMMHVSDPVARFHPIGPGNERYEAGMWRDTPEGNYYNSGMPHYDEIFEHREKMLAKHPETTFVLAHVASMGWDLKRVSALLDAFPNAHIETSARLQELGRQPYTARRFFLKYQDRILFGSDGEPGRQAGRFWRPHWRFLETDDEYFDHPAQMLSPLGAPLQGRWKIYGIYLPDQVLRKVYYENALRLLPGAREPLAKML